MAPARAQMSFGVPRYTSTPPPLLSLQTAVFDRSDTPPKSRKVEKRNTENLQANKFSEGNKIGEEI
ncbi:hypothetical protein GBA52_012259 [Prunus armeniaca]|nr:hypothetical protein GBA52_012259 [Prunus armeniaca]